MTREQELLIKAKEKIEQQQEQLKELTAPVYLVGTIRANFLTSVIVQTGNGIMELEQTNIRAINYPVGSSVLIHPMTGQIVRGSKFVELGPTGKVKRIYPDGLVQVQVDSAIISIQYNGHKDVKEGDTVILVASSSNIVRTLEDKSDYVFEATEEITWEDIGGQEEAKSALREALELPYQYSKVFTAYKKKQAKGFLFHGLPGNGKTMLGKASATALAKIHGKAPAKSGFIYIKGPEILSKWVGESEERIRQMFISAKIHKQKNNYPAVIFIDEADSLLGVRGQHTTSGMEHTIVPQFLSEMDGMVTSDAIVLLATNRVDTLDPAVIRPGRIDRKIYISPPNEETSKAIFRIHLNGIPKSKIESFDSIVDSANSELFSNKYLLYEFSTRTGEVIPFNLGNIVSGAMIANVVEQATLIAIKRDISDKPKGDPSGVNANDFTTALTKIHSEQRGLKHDLEIKEFISKCPDVVGIRPGKV